MTTSATITIQPLGSCRCPTGAGGGGVLAVPQRVLHAHPGPGPGGTPVCAAARHHGRPGHGEAPAGAVCAGALRPDRGLPQGQPPVPADPPGSGEGLQENVSTLALLFLKRV